MFVKAIATTRDHLGPIARRCRRAVMSFGNQTCDLLFPRTCLLCGDLLSPNISDVNEPLVCARCTSDFGYASAAMCTVCAAPLPKIGEKPADCLYCQERRYRFAATMSLGTYRGQLREAVLRMKLATHESLSLAMGNVLADRVDPWLQAEPPDVVAPIPMYWLRRLWRGINAPELIAEALAQRCRWPLALDLIYCQRKSKKQGTLLPGERFRNVKGVYLVSSRYELHRAHVLLIDDIMTTGATANEAAKLLLRAGARRVSVAVLARGTGM